MNDHEEFRRKCAEEIKIQGESTQFQELTREWTRCAAEFKYSYHFNWLGRPIIQHPQDMLAIQHILWGVKPDLVVETGIARGGSLIFYASLLELIAQCGGPSDASVLGVDIDIRPHNRDAILAHPLSKRITLLEGSSVDDSVIRQVHERAAKSKRVLICLDSNHTHAHVLSELQAYAPLVSRGSYCIVFDTIIEDIEEPFSRDRAWGRGDNPKTAVIQYLDNLANSPTQDANGAPVKFTVDTSIESTIMITVASHGFLRRE